MKASVKIHWAKLCILALLLVLVGQSPAYACSPEIEAAIAQLQKSARTEANADKWLKQIVNETSYFYKVNASGRITGRASAKQLSAALFFDGRSLIYLKRYLAEVKIRQNPDEKISNRIFLFNGISYNFYYIYPSSGTLDTSSGSACQFSVGMLVVTPEEGWDHMGETTYKYDFDFVGGKMKLIANVVLG